MTRRHSVSHAPTNTIAAALPRGRGLVHPHHTHDQPERDSEPNQTINKQRPASSSQQRSRAFLSVPERSRAPVRGQKRRCSRSFGRVRAPVEGGGLFSANVWRPNQPRNAPANAPRQEWTSRGRLHRRPPPRHRPRTSAPHPTTKRIETEGTPTQSIADPVSIVGGHVAARWRPTVLPSGGQQDCPR